LVVVFGETSVLLSRNNVSDSCLPEFSLEAAL
jgi:hypothetical protein